MNLIHETILKYGVDAVKDTDILTTLTGITEDNSSMLLQEHNLADMIKYIDTFKITKTQKHKLLLLYDFVRRVSTANSKRKFFLMPVAKPANFS